MIPETQILSTIGVLVGYILVYGMTRKLIRRLGNMKNVPPQRTVYVLKYFNALLIFAAALLISFIWSVDYKGLLVLASSAFAVIGVALFAQWSILGNVTASIVIFFTFPAKIGDRIKIIDGDDTVTGEIVEITLFQVLLKGENDETISYPNSLLLQKPVAKI